MTLNAIELVQNDCSSVLSDGHSGLSALKNSTLVVSGGTGFVGTWIAEFVAQLNDRFNFGIDLHLISRRTDEFKFRWPHLSNRKDVTLQSSDIRYLQELPKSTNFVIQAAGTPDARFHTTNPVETMLTIADGTASLLRAIDRCSNFSMLLNMSSGTIYGAQPFDLDRIPETYTGSSACGTSSSSYAEAKRFGETLCAAARSQARIPLLSVRPFAFMGPYQSLDSPWAVNNFIRDALSGNPIRILGDGQTTRSYLYASDMGYWLLKILSNGSSGDVFNIGSDEPIALRELAEKVASCFSPTPAVLLRTGSAMNVSRSLFVPDISRARKNLKLSITVPLEQAIRKTIEWNQALKKS